MCVCRHNILQGAGFSSTEMFKKTTSWRTLGNSATNHSMDSTVQVAGNNPELWSHAHTVTRGVDLLIYG